MTVRMGYDFAMTVKYDESEATPLDRGRDNKNDIRVKRQLENLMKGLMIWKTNSFVPMMWHRN